MADDSTPGRSSSEGENRTYPTTGWASWFSDREHLQLSRRERWKRFRGEAGPVLMSGTAFVLLVFFLHRDQLPLADEIAIIVVVTVVAAVLQGLAKAYLGPRVRP